MSPITWSHSYRKGKGEKEKRKKKTVLTTHVNPKDNWNIIFTSTKRDFLVQALSFTIETEAQKDEGMPKITICRRFLTITKNYYYYSYFLPRLIIFRGVFQFISINYFQMREQT